LDITSNTRWENSPDLKIIEGTVRFQPLIDYADGSQQAAKISLDFTFKNQGARPIKQIDFDVVAYNSNLETANDSAAKDFKIKRYTYHHILSFGESGGMSVDWSGWDVTLPMRQTVRVARILYEDGTVWERRVGKAPTD
jgi:hypothetical protein